MTLPPAWNPSSTVAERTQHTAAEITGGKCPCDFFDCPPRGAQELQRTTNSDPAPPPPCHLQVQTYAHISELKDCLPATAWWLTPSMTSLPVLCLLTCLFLWWHHGGFRHRLEWRRCGLQRQEWFDSTFCVSERLQVAQPGESNATLQEWKCHVTFTTCPVRLTTPWSPLPKSPEACDRRQTSQHHCDLLTDWTWQNEYSRRLNRPRRHTDAQLPAGFPPPSTRRFRPGNTETKHFTSKTKEIWKKAAEDQVQKLKSSDLLAWIVFHIGCSVWYSDYQYSLIW